MTKKKRITLVVPETTDEGFVTTWLYALEPGTQGTLTVESVEVIPEPNRVQEFRVVLKTDPDLPPWTRDRLDRGIRFTEHMQGGTRLTVTEVEPT